MIAQLYLNPNVAFVLYDKNGKAKPMWQENALHLWLMKKGWYSPYWWKIPLLLGRWASRKDIRNLVTSAGKAGVADVVGPQGSAAAYNYIAVGTGTNAAAAGDTTLQTELASSGLSRAAATMSRVTTSVTNDTAQALKSFSVTGTQAVTESGLFNASSSGTLLARQVFSAINVVNGDTLQITWKIQFS